jgi:glyoxylase-like metal-dependent hydrolase (beta-lactamase superfamily II)
MKFKALFDETTFTLTYIVWDDTSKDGIIIDPVLDFDPASVSTSRESVNKLVNEIKTLGVNVKYIVETHAHADHVSSAKVLIDNYFKDAKNVIGAKITAVQDVFKGAFNFDQNFKVDGSQFGLLMKENDTLQVGNMTIKAIETPGHTPACMSFQIDDAVFCGDVIFIPDSGTGRCDFPSGSAENMYESIQKLYQLPDETRLFVGHDYQPGGRELKCETTVGESKKKNLLVRENIQKEEFVTIRKDRDNTLKAPRLIYPSVQVNIAAGNFPKAENNGTSYLKLPVSHQE